jgi:predicted O-methyltransferase YrrM
MNYQHFMERLTNLYEGWGTPEVRPKSDRFQAVLARVRGMTSPNVLQLLNLAVEAMEPDEVYAEVGCLQGATLIGALLGTASGRIAYAADNFTEYDRDGSNQAMLLNNLAAFGLQDRVRLRRQDFAEFFLKLRLSPVKIGVYFYDGAHDYRSHLLGLLLAVPFLAAQALVVVDDSNYPAVKQATWDFLTLRPESRLLLDLPTPGNEHPSFWNGVQVLSWDVCVRNEYDWPTLERMRQPGLLESLRALQFVHLKTEKGQIVAFPTPQS